MIFVVGPAGVEPTTYTRKQRLAAPTGFSKTAPEFRHPVLVSKPVAFFWSPSSCLARLQPPYITDWINLVVYNKNICLIQFKK